MARVRPAPWRFLTPCLVMRDMLLPRVAVLSVLATLLFAADARAGASTTTVSCPAPSPASTAIIGVQWSCNVMVTGTSIPTGTVTFSTGGEGVFTNEGMCTLVAGQCFGAVAYRPDAAGPHVITATYSGDVDNEPGIGTTTVTPDKRAAWMELDCPMVVSAFDKINCTVTVTDGSAEGLKAAPTGTVGIKSGLAGTWDSDTCTLVAQTCSFGFTPSAIGTHSFTATYAGDGKFKESMILRGTAVVSKTASEGFSLVCTPASVAVGGKVTCTALATDPKMEGAAATFTSTGKGAFAPQPGCVITAMACSVTYTPLAAGTDTISAQLLVGVLGMRTASDDVTVTPAPAAPGSDGGGGPAAPAVSLSAPATQKRKTLRATCVTAGAPIRACVVTLRRAGKRTVLGRASAASNGTAMKLGVKIKLTAAGRKLLKKARKPVKLQLQAQITPAGAAAATATKTVKVKP